MSSMQAEANPREPRYGSDLMAAAIETLGVRYVSLNPGATFRGLHDSLVNFLDGAVEMIECPHEKVAVGLAHGYAKASGEMMAVLLHDLVGLLHGAMGVYYAFADRAPVLVLGGSGPAAHERRRAYIDWVHSANTQGGAVRDYTKWDCEPVSIASVPAGLARAASIARSEPQGPTYVALDAALQEDVLPSGSPVPIRPRLPAPIAPEPAALADAAGRLLAAQRPVFVAGYAGRDREAFGHLVRLAEIVGAGVHDTFARLNFPNRHPLATWGTACLEEADCVVLLDMKDSEKALTTVDSLTRTTVSRLAEGCTVIDIGFQDLGISAWSDDYGAPRSADMMITADTRIAIPQLLRLCSQAVGDVPPRNASWRARISDQRAAAGARWSETLSASREAVPISPAFLAEQVWQVVRRYDWVLAGNTAEEWALRLWDFDAPHRYPGRQLGTATQIGIALGVALAHRGAGRLVVDLQPDGDLMYDAGALWVASYYRLPLLVVMVNNRAYYNDWAHQEVIARHRGTDVERAYIGMEIDHPAPDFAALARSFGWYADGPITEPAALPDAVKRAAEHVAATGEPALVDVVTRRR